MAAAMMASVSSSCSNIHSPKKPPHKISRPSSGSAVQARLRASVSPWLILRPLAVRPKSKEPMLLGKPVHPVFLGDFVAGIVLAVSADHRFEFGYPRAFLAMGRILRAVFHDQLLHEIGAFQHDAAARGFGGELAEVAQVFAVAENVQQIAAIVDGFLGELDDRAWLDLAPGINVMADARRHRAQGLALVVPVGVDHADRHFLAQPDDEPVSYTHLRAHET